MTPEGKWQRGRFGSKSGRVIAGAGDGRTGCGRREVPIAGAGPAAARGSGGVLSVSGQACAHDACNPQALWSLPQVAGRLHVEVMRVTGAVPERVAEDDSSENSSEGGSLEVVDSSGEVVHRVRKLTCRVRGQDGRAPINHRVQPRQLDKILGVFRRA